VDRSFNLGSNKFASQRGMNIGSVRHVSDIKADEPNRKGQGVLSKQTGETRLFSHMTF